MKYTAFVKVGKAEIERLNNLLLIDNFEDMTDEEMIAAGARDYDCIPVFCANFDDGSHIIVDVRSGSENYFDDVMFFDCLGNYVIFDCEYEICDNEYEVNNNTYKIIIEQE